MARNDPRRSHVASGRKLLALVCTCLPWSAVARAQTPAIPSAPPDPTAAAAAWLATDQTDRAARDAAVLALLRQPEVGARWLANELRLATEQPDEPRSKGAVGLHAQFVLGYLQKQRETDMTFVGQYDLLAQLEPRTGELLFRLLLETPDWYPLTFRIHLVAPLRDLHRKAPAGDRVDAMLQLVDDANEPENLRRAAAAALWQWNVKDPAKRIVAGLQQAIAECDAEERVQSTLLLADYWCLLREYKLSASAHRSAQALAKSTNSKLLPIHWYSAGCVHALLGEVDLGLAALEECARLLAAPELDASLRLPRSLFELDPELKSLRGDPRFAALVGKAFASRDTSAGTGR